MNRLIGTVDSEEEEEEKKALNEYANREDLFDVFIRLILVHAPSVYVFVNLTLLIWIGQTIFDSKLTAIPQSLYLIAPFFTQPAFSNLVLSPPNSGCPQDTTLLSLKTFPTIYQNHITRKELHNWDNPAFQICYKRFPSLSYKEPCLPNTTLCSGYCVNSRKECPITDIKVSSIPELDEGYEQFHQQNGRYYQLTRNEGTPLIGLNVFFQPLCANDGHSNEAYESEQKYWSTIKDCKQEGTAQSFFSTVDSMEMNTFLANNQIPLTLTDPALQTAYLGIIKEFQISNNPKQGCGDSYLQATSIQQFLNRSPVTPQYTQSVLIIAFILLVAELLWLAAYYCFNGMVLEKNLIVVMLSVVEFVVIGFIYNGNLQLFKVEKLSDTLAKCLKQQVPAIKEWHFGIDSPLVFQMVMFLNTAFLGLYLLAQLIDRFGFEDYKRLQVKLPRNQPRILE